VRALVDAGLAICARCGEPINPGDPVDVGHGDRDPNVITGPEHPRCNRGARAPQHHLAQVVTSLLASADVLDDLDQLVQAVALAAGEVHEVPRPLHDRATLGRPRNRDAAPAPELE
jgi:hypothetical protein